MPVASRSMARWRDGSARNFGSGPSANDNHAGPSGSSALPSNARATVEPVPPATSQGGRARRGQWRVRFAPRWQPEADPLTGWSGGGDPLGTIELRFADLDTASDYCRRQGLEFSVRGAAPVQRLIQGLLPAERPPVLCCWPTGPHARCCGAYPFLAQRDHIPKVSRAG